MGAKGENRMKNDFTTALDQPVGICTQNKGMNDCSRWPNRYPSPCCWLSCNELCGGACWKANKKYGDKCEYYRSEYCATNTS